MGNQQLFSLDVTSNTMHLISQPLSEYVTLSSYDGNLRPLDGNGILPAFTIDDKKIIMIKNSQFEMLKTDVVDPSASVAIVDVANGPAVLQTWIDDTQVIFYVIDVKLVSN